MPLSWNEIKARAITFAKDWEGTTDEQAEAQHFTIDFLNVFGISRKRVATFEHRVKKLNDADGYIDMLWKGMLLIEMKSRGKDLHKAYQQAREYCHGLQEHELPRLIIISDFYHFHIYDAEGDTTSFTLPHLHKNVQAFAPIAGYQKRTFREQDPVNIQAAELMGLLHDQLKNIGYQGHKLELYLVRLLFCLFADDTGIFDATIFHDYIAERTQPDGSDLAYHLAALFEVLNTPAKERITAMDEALAAFPYVNGKLFEETLPMAAFTAKMRHTLLQCCQLDWGRISPAIFGSLFQSVMDEKARRNLGAHYTSEKNILKVIKPLFLDALWAEYEGCNHDERKLKKLHEKLSRLRFLDPACGCGNFLIIAYRELRLLELEIVKKLSATALRKGSIQNVDYLFLLDVNQFYGIEYEEFPAQIAMVALWLIDHQMNQLASTTFGHYYARIPLRKSAKIVHANALRTEWQSLLEHMPWDKEAPRFDYIFGNPPFIGSKLMTQAQRDDIKSLYQHAEGAGVLDYVTGWYMLAAQYMQAHDTQAAFVSTNSIAQGEQVSILWPELMNRYGISISFAHQTFKWSNEARGIAAVYCVIVGFGRGDAKDKRLYLYEDIKGEPHEVKATHINAYLVDGKDVVVAKRQSPLCGVSKMSFGNMPLDGGHLLLSDEEKNAFLIKEPAAAKFIKPLISAHEFLNGQRRWCLWLVDAAPNELRALPEVMKRVNAVKKFRLDSVRASTNRAAETPMLFGEIRDFGETFIVIPRVSSENRRYIPMGFFDKNSIVSDTCMAIPDGTLYHFGMLTSAMHMAWVKYVCGRLESRFRYSKDIVYNNYPWPAAPTEAQKQAVAQAAQDVLDVRAQFQGASLADLYDPNTMPPALVKAHQALDRAVDRCYRAQPFASEAKRIEYLFDLYDTYVQGLYAAEGKKKKKK